MSAGAESFRRLPSPRRAKQLALEACRSIRGTCTEAIVACHSRRDRARAVKTYVVKPTQPVSISQDDDRLVSDFRGEERA